MSNRLFPGQIKFFNFFLFRTDILWLRDLDVKKIEVQIFEGFGYAMLEGNGEVIMVR